MSKDFTRGVTVGEGNAVKEETQVIAQQAVKEYETSEEDTRALIRANEEDFIQGLIDAAEFASEETQRIEIISHLTSGHSVLRNTRSAVKSTPNMCAISSSA